MRNIITYAEETLANFDRLPFNRVDSLILSWAAYLRLPEERLEAYDWRGVRLGDLFRAEDFGCLFQRHWDVPGSRQLLTAVAASPRFRDIRVMGYTQQMDAGLEKQFAAVTLQWEDRWGYIAFRGTDSTLVGWKEDFNMAFQYPVPSQEAAQRYLAQAAKHCKGELRVGGHSKGGNLAVYAAAHSAQEIQERLVRVYSHDGPGFLAAVLQSGEFQTIAPKLDKTLPQSSLVGMLLEQQENFRIVKSDRVGLWQHDPFSWLVEGNDFLLQEELTPDAQYLDKTLNRWISSLTTAERERFVDSLYALVDAAHIETLAQLRAQWQESIPAILKAASQLDPDTKEFLFQTGMALVALGVKNFPELLEGPGEDPPAAVQVRKKG
mgnify:CR=1 FL=1